MKSIILAVVIAVAVNGQTTEDGHPTSSLDGKVVNAITGEPLKNLRVTISGRGNTRTALSGPDGEFRAKDLEPGLIQISARSPRFPGLLGVDLGSVSLELKKGEDRSDVIVKVTPAGSISGTLRGDRNEPLQECSVRAEFVTSLRPAPQFGFSALSRQTDDKGEYRIDDLPAGRYFVLANCPESIPVQRPLSKDWNEPQESWLPVFFPDGQERSGATALTVMPSAETSGIDFRLHKTRVGSLRGDVKYSSSANRSSLELRLIPKANGQSENAWPVGQVVSADSVKFHLQYIPPGLYTVLATSLNPGPETFWYASSDVEIRAGHTETAALELRPGITVHGQVISAAGNVANGSAAAEKASVLFKSVDESSDQSRGGQVAEDGTFTVTNLIPGKWTIDLNSLDRDQAVQSITWGGEQVAANEIVVSESQTGPLKIFTDLSAGGSVTGSVGNAAEALRSESETPQPSLKAYAYPTVDGHIDANRTPRQIDMKNGQFRMDHLTPGEYFVLALNGNIRNVRPIADLMASQAEKFFVQDGATQTISVRVLSNEEIFHAALEYLQGSSGQR